jgi:hypothetical protein
MLKGFGSTYEFSICSVRREMLRLQLFLTLICCHRVVFVSIVGWSNLCELWVRDMIVFIVFRPDNVESGIMSVNISTGRGDAFGAAWLEFRLSWC